MQKQARAGVLGYGIGRMTVLEVVIAGKRAWIVAARGQD
jgi:hypothetical protein